MPALAVVERLDVLEHRGLQLEPRRPAAAVDELLLEGGEEVSATALSYAIPREPIETAIPASLAARPNAKTRMGGFNRSSQHSMRGVAMGAEVSERRIGLGGRRCVRRGVRRWGVGSIGSGSGQRSPRRDERGRWRGGGSVAGGWRPVVQGGWRDAVGHPGAAVGTLPVVRRAGGDRSAARSRVRGSGDRAAARSFAVDDLPRAASERCDPRWRS